MEDFTDKPERFYFGRTRRPHCKTCLCPDEVKLKTKVNVSKKKIFPRPRSFINVRDCVYSCHRPLKSPWKEDIDELCVPRLSPHRCDRRVHCEHKYKTLDKWFKRFDFDSDGLLDLFELRTLLNFLGVRATDSYCKRLLENADRDGDGRLSFAEFLIMWRQAQEEDNLLDVIREHDLYPDVFVHNLHPRTQVREVMKQKHGREYHCGCTTKTFRKSPGDGMMEYEMKISHSPPVCADKLPIFSCYR